MLVPSYPWLLAVLGSGAGILALATAGALWPATRSMPRVVSVISFGVAANVAVLHATWRLLRTHDDSRWEPTRREPIVQLHGSGS